MTSRNHHGYFAKEMNLNDNLPSLDLHLYGALNFALAMNPLKERRKDRDITFRSYFEYVLAFIKRKFFENTTETNDGWINFNNNLETSFKYVNIHGNLFDFDHNDAFKEIRDNFLIDSKEIVLAGLFSRRKTYFNQIQNYLMDHQLIQLIHPLMVHLDGYHCLAQMRILHNNRGNL